LFVLSANPHRPARDAAMMPGCARLRDRRPTDRP
jgi:hypothetical protein